MYNGPWRTITFPMRHTNVARTTTMQAHNTPFLVAVMMCRCSSLHVSYRLLVGLRGPRQTLTVGPAGTPHRTVVHCIYIYMFAADSEARVVSQLFQRLFGYVRAPNCYAWFERGGCWTIRGSHSSYFHMCSHLAPTDTAKQSESTASAANPRSCECIPTHSLSWLLIFSARTEQLRMRVGATAADGLRVIIL
jgi:hypothetical protein